MPTPVIPVESFASRQDITPSLAVWRDCHLLFEALSNSTDLREHAHIGDHSIWPLVESELAGVPTCSCPGRRAPWTRPVRRSIVSPRMWR